MATNVVVRTDDVNKTLSIVGQNVLFHYSPARDIAA
jgi:hypothetical protein